MSMQGGGINTIQVRGERVHITDLDPVTLCRVWAERQRELNELYEINLRISRGWTGAILALFGVHLPCRRPQRRDDPSGEAAMNMQVLTLTDDQLYEVYNAAWREFVELHRHVTTNPNGAHEAVIERARQSRTAIGEVCDMIEALKPELKATREDYTTARAEASQVQ